MGHDIGLAEFGWPVGMPLCRPLGGGLWEMRSNLTHGWLARVIFCAAQGHMVLLHSFIKKARKMPAPDSSGQKTAKGGWTTTNKHIGSSFDGFLKEEGIYEDVTGRAIKCVLAWQIEQAMKAQGLTKSEMAKRMNTSRTQLDRLLDPDNDKVQLDTMRRAAAAVGRKLHLELT